MAAKETHQIIARNLVLYSAPTRQKLIEQVVKDRDHWTRTLSTELSDDRGRVVLRTNYPALMNRISNAPEGETTFDVGNDPNFPIFPPRLHPEASLIDYLIGTGSTAHVSAVVLFWFVARGWKPSQVTVVGSTSGTSELLGSALVASWRAAEEAVSSVPHVRRLEADVEALSSRIAEQDRTAAAYEVARDGHLDRFGDAALRAQRRFQAFRRLTRKSVQTEEKRRLEQAKEWENDFQQLRASFVQELRYKAPVELWSTKAGQHRKSSYWALGLALGIAALTILAAGILVVCFGEAFEASFTKITCLPEGECSSAFSARGPLTLGAILLVASIAIWAMRFFARIYLSERHLALGAEERKAFTETYLALVTDKTVTGEQEAIVLAALFRPTQDGVVKDDDATMDISAAAIIAKAMSSPRA